MPTYISLLRYTQKGIESVKEGGLRFADAQQVIRASGGELKAYYVTMGHYDGVAIMEFPDDESAARMILATSSRGNVRSETLHAFSLEQFTNIISKLP
jgi:uncharacterized protein with GYD domain